MAALYGDIVESSMAGRGTSRARRQWPVSGVTFLKFGPRGKKHIERDLIVGSKLEKLHAEVVVFHPLDGGEADFHWWLIPGKSQKESEFLAGLK